MEKKEEEMKLNHIYCGDVIRILKTMPDECVNTIITSPPYWGLRDYGEDTKTIWDGDENCEHNFGQWENKEKLIKEHKKYQNEWERPSRKEYEKVSIKKKCPVCGKEFDAKPHQQFCSTKCLNTLSNEQRTTIKAKQQFCQKCGAWYGQLGLESTLDLYLSHLWQITDELYRVLRKDGIMFWNHGDSYNSSPPGNKQGQMAKQLKDGDGVYGRLIKRYGGDEAKFKRELKNYPTKCLCLQNYRLILGMVDIDYRILVEWRAIGKPENKLEYMLKHPKIQGILRNSIIWNKSNHMPSSVKDRFANSYEPVFMLVKQSNPQYYYNIKTGLMADRKAKEPKENIDWEWRPCPKCTNKEYFNVRVRDSHLNRFIEKATEKETESIKKGECPRCKGTGKIKYSFWRALDYWFDLDIIRAAPTSELNYERPRMGQGNQTIYEQKRAGGFVRARELEYKTKTEIFGNPIPKHHRNKTQNEDYKKSGMRNAPEPGEPNAFHNIGKNPGDVFIIPTQPFPEAHFATFPEKLIQPMILVGCPRWVCKKCGKARVRITSKEYTTSEGQPPPFTKQQGKKFQGKVKGEKKFATRYEVISKTKGWTDCGCNAGWDAGIVLDPFMGAGTVGVVATKSGRDYVGIEIKREYCEMAEKRIKNITPSFL